MKKIMSLMFVLSLAMPFAASAATFIVSPSSGSYSVGDTIVLTVSANPTGSTIYTAMLDARFSADTLEVASFTLNDSLLALKQSGYDALNNASGILTKTGGYTGGITSASSFGVIVLRAKAAGTGSFTVADSSKLLDANNTDQQSGAQTASFAITAKQVQQTVPTTPTAPVTQTVAQSSNSTNEEQVEPVQARETIAQASETPTTSAQVATVESVGTSSMLMWVMWLISLIAAFLAGYYVRHKRWF